MVAAYQSQHFIIADGHVHLHECFDLGKLLTSALGNFQAVAQRMGLSESFSPVLFLTEISNQDCFARCWNHAQQENQIGRSNDSWKFHGTSENLSLRATNQEDQEIFLIAGRQIVTEEGLEVLALVTNETFEAKLPLDKTVKLILSKGGIPVFPWGVGKWIGKRGKILAGYLRKNSDLAIFLGDNSGRPALWPFPSTLCQTEKQLLPILPGTDPLPIAAEAGRPGSFGFTVQSQLNAQEPGLQLKDILIKSSNSIQPYGASETLPRFLRNQFLLRYNN